MLGDKHSLHNILCLTAYGDKEYNALLGVDMDRSEILTRKEVYEYLGISDKTMYRWMKAKRLPEPMQLGERAFCWSREAIEAFKARGCR